MAERKVTTGSVVTLWMRTARLIQNRIFCEGKLGTVNPQQMHALFVVSENDGLTMKELAGKLEITSPSATSLVNRLVRLKWVTRAADPKNRKLVRVRIAPEGTQFLKAKTEEVAGAMKNVLGLLNADDRHDFARILTNLHEALLRDAKR